jgi:DNA-directed RNA polymerase beta' subunit
LNFFRYSLLYKYSTPVPNIISLIFQHFSQILNKAVIHYENDDSIRYIMRNMGKKGDFCNNGEINRLLGIQIVSK